MAGDKAQLHNCLQALLRENPVCRYDDMGSQGGVYRARVCIGSAFWFGSSYFGAIDAEHNAAFNAKLHIEHVGNEGGVRELLGLPPRRHLLEIDGVRDQLRELKQRIRQGAGDEARSFALREIGLLYGAIDNCEKLVMEKLGVSD